MLGLGFGHPWVLLLLAAPALLLAWIWRRSGRRVVLPFDHAGPRSGVLLRVLLQGAESLPALGLAAAVLILAGPRSLDAPTTRRALTNIEFCVDISGSMTGAFGEGSRYDAAMAAINGFLDYRTGDAFGLTFFGNNVLHWVPLTSDTSAFRCAPPFMNPSSGNMPRWFGGTEIGKALRACRDVLVSREEGDRMIILISDGISSDLRNGADMELARLLREDGIQVYGVHVADSRIPAEVVNIATITGGQMFGAGDPAALDTVFRRIDEMRVTRLEQVAADFTDDFHLLAWLGIGLLALHLLLQFAVRYTPW